MRFVNCVSLCSLFLAGACLAQGGQTAEKPTQRPITATILPPGTIDGSKTPELIPDATAYRLFFAAISEPSIKTSREAERERVKLLPAELTPEDLQVVIAVLDSFFDQKRDLELRYKKLRSGVSTAAKANIEQALSTERDALVSNTRDTLSSRLSIEGLLKLDRLVQREKARMIMAPFPEMPGMPLR